MRNNFILNKLFIVFFLLVTVLINIVAVNFDFSAKMVTAEDNAILSRLFSCSDMYLKDISKVFQNNVIISKTQNIPMKNNFEQNFFSDIIFMEHFNFTGYTEFFYVGLMVTALFLSGYFNLIYFNFDLWRCIVFLLIFKMLFNILPRSISIKTLLNTESLCFVC